MPLQKKHTNFHNSLFLSLIISVNCCMEIKWKFHVKNQIIFDQIVFSTAAYEYIDTYSFASILLSFFMTPPSSCSVRRLSFS